MPQTPPPPEHPPTAEHPASKRPYRAPQLADLGSVTETTRNTNGGTGTDDLGAGPIYQTI